MPADIAAPAGWAWRRSPPGVGVPVLASVLDVLRDAAAQRCATPALVGSAERLTYPALLDRALAVAHALDSVVAPGAPVATLLPHSPAGVVAILGCLLAGRICVPLNTTDPPERQAVLLADAGPALVLAPPGLSAGPSLDPATLPPAPAGWQPAVPDADAPAMVHYTSGSTGRPKGIVVSHHAVLHRARHCIPDCAMLAGDRVLAITAPSVGSGFSFVLATLAAGATMLVASLPGEGAGPLLRLAARERATVLVAAPAILRLLLGLPAAGGALAALRHVRIGAMALPRADILAFRAALPDGCAISHTYASTEAMVVARWTIAPGAEGDDATLAAGLLAPDQDYALLDDAGRAVADGDAGELVLRGRHIALGEWQRGRLVPGRMPADPAQPGSRIFRTGDRMRLGPDGMLRFAGRIDRQVKVHGLRVEPAEIEAVLRGADAVLDAAVVADPAGRLHAFVAAPHAREAVLRRDLAARLRAALPPALRPWRITLLAALPLLAGGKPDLEALRRAAAAA